MKIFAFAFAILTAGVSAVPSLSQTITDAEATKVTERFIDGIIADVIAGIAQDIRDAGLDPINIERLSENYKLPVTDLVNVDVLVENLASHGLSNIVINHINYGILTSRLQMTLSLPRIFIGVDNAAVNAEILGFQINAGIGGNLAIVEARVVADVRINIGIISGISIRSADIDFTLGGIESNLNVNILGDDYSNVINEFTGERLPNALAVNRAEINELLEYLIIQLV